LATIVFASGVSCCAPNNSTNGGARIGAEATRFVHGSPRVLNAASASISGTISPREKQTTSMTPEARVRIHIDKLLADAGWHVCDFKAADNVLYADGEASVSL
jgi:hypothetical protein